MKSETLNDQVMAALVADSRLTESWSRNPSMTLIPVNPERSSFFLVISVCLIPQAEKFDEIAHTCLSVVRLAASSGALEGLFGVEVVPYIEERPQKPRRILRFSVKATAFAAAIKLTPPDLLRPEPAEGISCGWYVSPPEK
jgi:hypothetical protein